MTAQKKNKFRYVTSLPMERQLWASLQWHCFWKYAIMSGITMRRYKGGAAPITPQFA